ncbi:MAG TPA: penicillin acylase family protein, partial [Myxococcota bacterium]
MIRERIMLLRSLSLVVVANALASCHPLASFIPKDLPKDVPLVLTSTAEWPKSDVNVIVDDLGIPHIYGQSESDLAYALGVMHGRDRAFQIYLYIHAGEGRLSEILGDEVLDLDRENRLLMTGADEQIKAFAPRDLEMANAYCAGLNQGAAMAGRSAEMAILGVDWEPVTPRDVLAVVRLQQWDQSVGLRQELARYRLVQALGDNNPVVTALLQDSPSGGVPVVAASEDEARPAAPSTPPTPASTPPPEPAKQAPTDAPHDAAPPSGGGELAQQIRALFTRGGRGASNSWSVAPALTQKGVAVLANDPHLEHSAPGIFYMADMHGPDFVVAGGTFPGIPAVLIGHGEHIAWGVTNAYADTQDVVLLTRSDDGNSYLVDGKEVPFGLVPQTFKLGHGKDAKVHTETWRTSQFGPLLPTGYDDGFVTDKTDMALLWSAVQFPQDNGHLVSAFWDLAKSNNVDDATKAVQDFASPAMSVNMAFTDGTIAYRLSGIIPVRGDSQRADYPRQGTSASAGWVGRVSADDKPHETSPHKGYIVASNQRVVEDGVGAQASVGFEAARPYRALRIDARIRALVADGKKAKTEDLFAIEQDITAIDAQQLAPIIARHCPKQVPGYVDAQVARFCHAIGTFNGVFTTDSIALPYARTSDELGKAILRAHVDAKVADALLEQSFADMALVDAVVGEDAGQRSPLLDDPKTTGHDGLDPFVATAVQNAMALVFSEAGPSEDDWRWGKLHTLSLRGALSRAPFIGGLFETKPVEQAGYGSTPRAEHADPRHKMRVVDGAGLRLIAEMTTPPTVKMVNDSGQSG